MGSRVTRVMDFRPADLQLATPSILDLESGTGQADGRTDGRTDRQTDNGHQCQFVRNGSNVVGRYVFVTLRAS